MDNSIGNQKTIGGKPPDGRSLGSVKTMRPGGARPAGRRFSAGDVILGRYRVTDELGQGGMGVVYRCFDDVAGVEVALKALPPEVAHNSGEMEEVRENFRLVSKLHHPNIANVNTLERDAATGDYYLVMECVDGLDLRQWARRRRSEGRSLTLDEVVILAHSMASALDYAHGQKVIHRDIKPSNVRVNFEGDVKVLDFGLAAQLHTSLSRVSQAYHGTSGTGPYMAPEQWQGRRQGAEADQYALAATVYELLSGVPPFESHDPAVLREAVLKQEPLPLEGVPPHVNAALLRGLAKEPGGRFASCGEFVAALAGNGSQKIRAGRQETEDRRQETEVRRQETGDRKQESGNGSRKTAWYLCLAGALVVVVLAMVYARIRIVQTRAHEAAKQAESLAAAQHVQVEAEHLAREKADAEEIRRIVEQKAQEERKRAATEQQRIAELSAKPDTARLEKTDEARLAKERADAEDDARRIVEQKTKEERKKAEVAKQQMAAEKESKYKVPDEGREWRSPRTGMGFVWIPALKVWMGKFEVTNGEFRKYNPQHDSGVNLNANRQPVVQVNFDDAKEYATWLTEKEHLFEELPEDFNYRLPSEAEWFVCAQCGDGREFPWGKTWPPQSGREGNYCGQETQGLFQGMIDDYNDGSVRSCPVEQSQPNPWGLYGMGGNVWEWCVSDKDVTAFGARRGGSWRTNSRIELSCAYRYASDPSIRLSWYGFRLVLSH